MKKIHRNTLFSMLAMVVCPLLVANPGAVRQELEAPTQVSLRLPDLPQGLASFGATVHGDWLYVFGGHVGGTHKHSMANLSHHFRRLHLDSPSAWEDLGPITGLQGLPMVSYGDHVCRIGGLAARNATTDEAEDLVSQDEVACYHTTTGAWSQLAPLPAPRSSHDAVVLDGRLYVVGGWQLRGQGEDSLWHETMAVLDLETPGAAWRSLPQPFTRRALAVAAADGKIFALGGIDPQGTSLEVDVFDPTAGTWSKGPELPAQEGRLKGFGVAAFGVDDEVFLSGADGRVHELDPTGQWREEVGHLETPRFFHRLLPYGEQLLFVAGAHHDGHLAGVESLSLASLRAKEAMATQSSEGVSRGQWPGFRGDGGGEVSFDQMPLHWSDEENVAWKVVLPGYGQSSPVVWENQVFSTSVEGAMSETLLLSAFDLDSGAVRWRRRFSASQRKEASEMVSRGAPTPVVDGERVVAFWESGDLLAVDLEGVVLWRRSLTEEFGPFLGNHGVASSLVEAGHAVVVQVTHEGPSYFLAVDRTSGQTLWKVERPAKVAWTTPVVMQNGDRTEILSSAAGRVEVLDAGSGEILWHLEGLEKNHTASPVVTENMIIVPSSSPGHSLALHRRPPGDERILWHTSGVTSGFGSPVVHGACVLLVNKAGVATCLDRQSGEQRWQTRLGEDCWASPISARDHVFFFTKKGKTVVLRPDATGPGTVVENQLSIDDTVYGVAAVRGAFLIRTGTELIRVGTGALDQSMALQTAP